MPTQNVQNVVNLIETNIILPLMALLIGVGLVVFMFGVVEFLFSIGANVGDAKERGKKHMLWGVIGMAVMACAAGILTFIMGTVCPASGCSM